MNLDTVLDGREETGINITHETKHFRFEINRSTGWPTTALFVIQSTWSNTSGHTGEVTLETWDGSVWIQRDSWVYSNFQRGYNLHTTTQVHNGQNSMRVTIKMDWTDATHNYIPLRRILLLSNYSGSIYDMQPFYWGYNKEVTFASSINVSGGNSGNWNTAYGWGDHAGLYLGATAKAADSELLDGIDSTGFLRVAPNSGTPLSANFAIGSAGGRNFIQSHASQPLDINPLGNSVSVGSNLTVSGNVGIGTTSPGYPLDILDNSTRLSFSTGTGNAIIYMDGANGDLAGGDYTSLTSDGSGNFSIATGNSERLRVQHGGNVGIGTDSPTGKLHVYGGRLVLDNPANAQTAIQINSAGTEKIVIYRPTSTEDLRIYTPGAGDAFTLTQSGNVGIGTTSPGAPLDVQPNSSYKVTKVGDDRTSHYKFTGQSDHTLTLASGSYHSAEVVITAHQTNGGTNNNLYIRGIWTNNHTSHHWHEIENIGGLSGSTFTIRNGQNGNTENSGELEIFHDYISASFAQMVVRVTDHYGTHSYTIS
jgi:hypothetical protein